MPNNRVLTIQQIIESENNFINQNSQEKIFEIAGVKLANFFFKNYKKKKILFICGKGNNGIDGLKASYFLEKNKKKTIVFVLKKKISTYDVSDLEKKISNTDIVVDCIFGIGLNRDISGQTKKIIGLINKSKKTVISIDVPSGVHADNGSISEYSIIANQTLCMGFFKPAHFLLPSKLNCGQKLLLNLNLSIPKKMEPIIRLIDKKQILGHVPVFKDNVNKYNKGHVLVVGGEMSGASRLVAIAARKIGAGLSTIAIQSKHLKFYSGVEPGTIISELNQNVLGKKNVLVIGPGLGKNFDRDIILELIRKFDGPIIVDADAISNFENDRERFKTLLRKKKKVLLTPHSGEFKRIFKYSKNNKILDCLNASKSIRNSIIHKGNDTTVVFPDGSVWLNDGASVNLATAGSGDILCGMIAGLMAQKMSFKRSILASLYIQNQLSKMEECVIAEDFLINIPRVLRAIKNNN